MRRPAGHARLARFQQAKAEPERTVGLAADHPAVVEGRALFPNRVSPTAGSMRFLVSGVNNSKIGKTVEKGPWTGMPVFTLTLEERRTCPRSCEVWRECYGNSQQWPSRWDHTDPAFIPTLAAEVITLARQHPKGFVVRLHVLGDFYSVEYVLFWAEMLAKLPSLRIYGYTARTVVDADPQSAKIARAIDLLTSSMWSRFAIRTSSSADVALSRAIVVETEEEASDVGAILCPAQTSKTEICGTCALCWADGARDKTIAFLRHGMKRASGPRLAVVPKAEPPRHPVSPPARQETPPGHVKPYETDTYPEAVMKALERLAGASGSVTITLSKLAAETGVPNGSVLFILRALADAGRIAIQKNTRPGSRAPAPNTYRILGDVTVAKEAAKAPAPPPPPAPKAALPIVVRPPRDPAREADFWEKVDAPKPTPGTPIQAFDVPAFPAPAPTIGEEPAAEFERLELPEEPTGPGIKTLIDLRACECHWPVGEARPIQMYCAEPTEPGREYCDDHASIMFAGHRAAKRSPAGARL